MHNLHVKITYDIITQEFKVGYYYGTDLRYDGKYKELPNFEIFRWLNNSN